METRRAPFRVGITGSYGGLNLGDEAILQAIVSQLRQAIPVEITVFSREPKDTLARHKVERAVPVRDLSRDEVLPEVQRLGLLILGGGGILFDSEAGHEAHSSYRVMPTAMATGQAAGVCAALAARTGRMPREIPAAAVQEELRRQGAVLGMSPGRTLGQRRSG